jgi:transporter family protein
MMPWQLLVLVSAFFAAVTTVLQRVFLKDKKTDSVAFAGVYQLLCAVILGTIGVATGNFVITDLSMVWPNVMLSGFLYALGTMFIFLGLKSGEASKFTVIFSSRTLFTILAAFLFLGETMGGNQLIGVFLIIGSILIISFTPDSMSFDKDERYALFAAIAFGLATVNDKFVIGQMNFFWFLFLGFVLPGVFIFFMRPVSIQKVKALLHYRMMRGITIISLIYCIGTLAFYTALSYAKSSEVASLGITSVVFAEILALVFLGERNNIAFKVVGTIVAVVGVYFVITV